MSETYICIKDTYHGLPGARTLFKVGDELHPNAGKPNKHFKARSEMVAELKKKGIYMPESAASEDVAKTFQATK